MDSATMAIVERLKGERAPLAEWRREALARNAAGQQGKAFHVLKAGLENESATAPHAERAQALNMLGANCISQAMSAKRGQSSAVELLRQASIFIQQAEDLDSNVGSRNVMESLVNRGFLALTKSAEDGPNAAAELKRAELLFTEALRIDPDMPRAVLGRAVIFAHHKKWHKALSLIRQVFAHAAPAAPRDGIQLRSLKKLRFALARCFCNLARLEQTQASLKQVIAADPTDVESLCALALLEEKTTNDGVGRSMEYLEEAMGADQNHPVVLLQMANSAFYCGLEEIESGTNGANTNGGQSTNFDTAKNLLEKVVSASQSSQVKAEAYFQLGRLFHAQEKYEEAYVNLKLCRQLQPEHCPCLFRLAQCCIQKKRYKEASALLEQVRKLKGDMPEILKTLSFTYLMTGKEKESADLSQKLVKLDPNDIEAWSMKAEAEDLLLAAQEENANSQSVQKAGLEAYENIARLMEAADDADSDKTTPQMMNNLGTLRQLQGDIAGAREAYSKGLDLIEKRLAEEREVVDDEAKELHIARLTMKFNRAWLSETSGDHPDHMQATQEYLSIREEHGWYADTLLRLGSQWNKVGDTDRAVQTFEEAQKHGHPVLASLMAAEAFRQQGNFDKAIERAAVAVAKSSEKQLHYALVYKGNLHFQVGSGAFALPRDAEKQMHYALQAYTDALKSQKDSQYAANGIGMVFAHRGKLDFARKTFQSVMQHSSMKSDPAVYVNLGHTHLHTFLLQNTEGDSGGHLRKAINLYERAVKLKPRDLDLRLYLAKAHYGRKDWDRCMSILSDAMMMWPDNLLLQFNLAVTLQDFGQDLMTQGARNVKIDPLKSAMEKLDSAIRLYTYIEKRWAALPDEKRTEIAASSGAPPNLRKKMAEVDLSKDYADYIRDKAEEMISTMSQQQDEQKRNVDEVTRRKKDEEDRARSQQEGEIEKEKDREKEMEDQALQLMYDSVNIQLGKNIAGQKDAPKAVQKKPKIPGGLPSDDKKAKKEKKDKKDKDKKDKKDKKKDKKDKKRKREDGGSESDEAGEDDEPGDAGGKTAGEGDAGEQQLVPMDGDALPVLLPTKKDDLVDGEEEVAFGGDDDDGDKKKKKDKKEKKEKKKDKKKDKKKSKKDDANDSDDAMQEKDAGQEEQDLEKDLFGDDD